MQNGADGLVANPKPSKLLTVLLPLVLVVAGGIAIWSRTGTDPGKSEVTRSTNATESQRRMNLDGGWQTAYMNPDGTQVNGVMLLKQKGDAIEGLGTDPKAKFQVTGKLVQNQQGKVQIQLSKQYLSSDKKPLGKPIANFGIIDAINPNGPYFIGNSEQKGETSILHTTAPGLIGKSTNLNYIHSRLPASGKGKFFAD